MVYSRGFHLSSSFWTSCSSLRVERRIISNTTEVHWRDQEYTYESGCVARETYQRLLKCWWRSNLVWLVDRIHEVSVVEWETSWTVHVVRAETHKHSSNYWTWSFVDRNLVRNVKGRREKVERGMGYWEAKARQYSKTERYLLHRSGRRRV